MASRAEQKAAARAQREALQAQHAEAAKRRQRLSIVAGVLGLAVILVGIAIIVSSSKSGASSKLTAPAALAVQKELAGIPQSGTRLGNPAAPVTIGFFGDFECPICKNFDLGTLPTLL